MVIEMQAAWEKHCEKYPQDKHNKTLELTFKLGFTHGANYQLDKRQEFLDKLYAIAGQGE